MMKQFLQFLIRVYQGILSPFGATRSSCRFLPTCSNYALEALEVHGALKGLKLIIARLFRCHPWGGCGFDPVPPVGEKKDEH